MHPPPDQVVRPAEIRAIGHAVGPLQILLIVTSINAPAWSTRCPSFVPIHYALELCPYNKCRAYRGSRGPPLAFPGREIASVDTRAHKCFKRLNPLSQDAVDLRNAAQNTTCACAAPGSPRRGSCIGISSRMRRELRISHRSCQTMLCYVDGGVLPESAGRSCHVQRQANSSHAGSHRRNYASPQHHALILQPSSDR